MLIPQIPFHPSVELTEEAIRDHADVIIWDTVWMTIQEVKNRMSEMLDITFNSFLVYLIIQKLWDQEE